MMRPEQERVKNLLSDTVTLLCKNGLTYKDELRVEALIGITLDNTDVFIVHINERFDSKEGKRDCETSVTQDSSKSFLSESLVRREATEPRSLANRKTDLCLNASQSLNSSDNLSSGDQTSIQTGDNYAPDENNGKVFIKVEDESVSLCSEPAKTSSIAQRGLIVAGQRRAHRKRPNVCTQNAQETEAKRQASPNYHDSEGGNISERFCDTEPTLSKQALDDYYLVQTEQSEISAQMMFDPSAHHLLQTDGSKAGCSSWQTGASGSRTGLQSDMIALLGGGSEARYPTLSGLQSHVHRQLLATNIIDPVINANGQMCAFRLSWYGKAGCDLDSAWNDIVAYQRHCDRLVTSFPGLAVVGSAFTGTVSGLKKGESGAGRRTYPGLAYFVVPSGDTFVYPNLLGRMEQNNMGAIMKPMLGLHEQTRQKLCSALYLVFKDNVDSGYVQRMVDTSSRNHSVGIDDMAANGEGGTNERHYPMVRFYVRGDDHWPSMVEAHGKLLEAGFKSTLHKLDE